MDLMRIKLSLVLGALLTAAPAAAGHVSFVPDVGRWSSVALRVSYDWGLGGGIGVHASHWIDPVGIGIPIIGATGGATRYRKGVRFYGGVQAGLIAGVGYGFYKQIGPDPKKGSYYDLWSLLPIELFEYTAASSFAGISFRQYRDGLPIKKTPADLSLFIIPSEILKWLPGQDSK